MDNKKHIKNFKSFNENLLKDLSNGVNRVFSGMKRPFSKNEPKSKLRKWKISSKKISDRYYQFLHDDRVIADLKVDDEEFNKPIFKLTIYYYDSEIPNTKKLNLGKKFDNQEEQPYAKGSEKFFSTEAAINFLTSFWSKKTNSGKNINPDHKIKL